MSGGDAHLTAEISDSVHVILGPSQNEGGPFQIQHDSSGFHSTMKTFGMDFSFWGSSLCFQFFLIFVPQKNTRN